MILFKRFSLLHSVQTVSGAHLSLLYNAYWGALSPGKKRPGSEAHHSPPSSADVKIGEAILPLLHKYS
jgi:hypothetical protein